MDELDDSSLLAIVSRLHRPEDLLRAASACTALASVCKAQSLWQQLLEQEFDLLVSAPPADGDAQAASPAAAAAAAAAAASPGGSSSSCVQLDLQQTFKALSCQPPAPRALRFAAVLTDGGCDGMADGDMTYWADAAFMPNHWSPHCSEGKANINIIGLLHPHGLEEDEALAGHRDYLVQRCAAPAAVLFSPPTAPHQTRHDAAAALATWSTSGLERLFMDLYQDLWLHQQDSTWGRLLLSGVPQTQWSAEFDTLGQTADAIVNNSRHRAYASVTSVRPMHLEAAAAAAAAAGGGCIAAAAGSDGQQQPCHKEQQQPSQVSMTAAAAATAVAAAAQQGSRAGGSVMQEQLLKQQQREQQRAQQLHMVNEGLLHWFRSPFLHQSTALIHEVVVSRVGHFTCPVAAGAVLLGQHPGCGSGGRRGVYFMQEYEAVLWAKHDPMLAALDNLSSYEQVAQAVSSGLLPPILQHVEVLGAEWVEFSPLSREQRLARQQQGWYMRPLLWFRFYTPPPDPAPADPAEGEAAAAAGEDAAAHPAAAAAAAPVVYDEAAVFDVEDAAAAEAAEDAAADVEGDIEGLFAGFMDDDDDDNNNDDDEPYHDGDGDDVMPPASPAHSESSSEPGCVFDDGDDDGDNDDPQGCWEDEQPAEQPAEQLAEQQQQQQLPAGDDELLPAELQPPSLDWQQQEQQVAAAAVTAAAAAAAAAAACGPPSSPPAVLPDHAQHTPPPQQQQQQQCPAATTPTSTSCSSGCSSGGSSSGGGRGSSGPSGPWQQRGLPGVTLVPGPEALQEAAHSSGDPASVLCMRLSAAPRSGNVAVLKLISCEDKMAEYDDPSEEPNIDVQYVALRGVSVVLQPGCGLTLL